MSIDHVTTMPPALWTAYAAGKAAHDDNPHATRQHGPAQTPHHIPRNAGPHVEKTRHALHHEAHAHPATLHQAAPVDDHPFDRLSTLTSRPAARLDPTPADFQTPMPSEAERFGVTNPGGPFGVPARCECPETPEVIEVRQPTITYAATRHPTGTLLDLFA